MEALLFVFFLAVFLTLTVSFLFFKFKYKSFETLSEKILNQAEEERKRKAEKINQELEELKKKHQRELFEEKQKESKKLFLEEERLHKKAESLEKSSSLLEKKQDELKILELSLKKQEESNLLKEHHLIEKLEQISLFSKKQAKEELKNTCQREIEEELATYLKNRLEETQDNLETISRKVIISAMNRMSHLVVSESSVVTISLPSDEMKGRIIGREGRNIRALESALKVNIVMDETPGAIVISSFNPLRRHIAKIALSELVLDGRIHPTRIEEVVLRAEESIEKEILKAGEEACYRAKVFNLHKELICLLGKLKFRDSVGQNVLEHSIEVSHLMGLMAEELGLNSEAARRIGLLHDIGKALTQEIEGTHALIGRDFAKKYGENELITNGIGAHHGEIEATSLEAELCKIADALSGARPGARATQLADYFKRLNKLEEIALEMEGVDKAYALQAGKEVRVLVKPEFDKGESLLLLARNLTKRIEKELTFSGKIRVTVTSEKRVVDYAM